MYPFKRTRLPSLAFANASNAAASTDAGSKKKTQIEGNSFNYFFWLVVTVTIAISVAPVTSIRNRGSCLACFTKIGIEENGTDIVTIDPRVARFWAESQAISALSNARLTSTAVATTPLTEMVPIFLGHPQSIDPGEQAWREKDPTMPSYVWGIIDPNAVSNLVNVGGATVALSAISINVYQMHNRNQKNLPYFATWIREIPLNIVQPNANQLLYLNSEKFLSALLIQQDAGVVGEVTDIVSALRLVSDVRDYIPVQVAFADLQREAEMQQGGAVYTPGTNSSYLAINFQTAGRLSNILAPKESNLRLDMNVTPTAAGGATSSIVRVTMIEKVNDLTSYVGPNGLPRQVCQALPFDV